MDNVIDINDRPLKVINDRPLKVINGDDLYEDVCEHCLGGIFKEGASHGNCHIGPPYAGVVVVPVQVQPTPANPQGIQMTMQNYSVFPPVERRHFCMAFEPKEADIQH